CQQNTGSPTF
nr:immunoglobulin light chain junction region [Macaca mulatta]